MTLCSQRIAIPVATYGWAMPLNVWIATREQGFALQGERPTQSGEFAESRIDIDELSENLSCLGETKRGCAENQGCSQRHLKAAVFAPHCVFPQIPSMIAPNHHDRILRDVVCFECVQEFANLGVGVAHAGVVTVNQLAS